jgi:glycosyltransferase involved in cell wall biosynthesis
VWGTEYNHSRAVLNAAKTIGALKHTIFDVQGILAVCAEYYANGLPEDVCAETWPGKVSINEEIQRWKKRAENEKKVFLEAVNASGRTDWDKFYLLSVNPKIKYLSCNRVLRPAFYSFQSKWSLEECQKHQIFVSQGGYPLKGLHHLLSAAKTLREDYDDLKVVVAGYFPSTKVEDVNSNTYGAYIEKLIIEYGLDGCIEFVGLLDENQMINEYMRAHVSVMCSNIENAPNSIIEAMYLGTPVIASNVGGVSDLIKHKRNGLLYQYEFDYMLEGYLRLIFSNDKLACQLSSNAIIDTAERTDPVTISEMQYKNYKLVAEQF